MLEKLHSRKYLELFIAPAVGFCFGFLLQKGGILNLGEFEKETLTEKFNTKPHNVITVIFSAILLFFAVLMIFNL